MKKPISALVAGSIILVFSTVTRGDGSSPAGNGGKKTDPANSPPASAATAGFCVDPSFGVKGILRINLQLGNRAPERVLLTASDGSIFLSGNINTQENNSQVDFGDVKAGLLTVQKFDPNGQPDSSFKSTGTDVPRPLREVAIFPRYLHFTPDGGVLSGGLFVFYGSAISIVNKYKADGSLDGNFGKNIPHKSDVEVYGLEISASGIRYVYLGSGRPLDKDLLVPLVVPGPRGKFFFGGTPEGLPREPEAVGKRPAIIRRFDPDGVLDRSFAKNGTLSLPASDHVADLVTLGDERMLLLAYRLKPADFGRPSLVVHRLLESGKFDPKWTPTDINAIVERATAAPRGPSKVPFWAPEKAVVYGTQLLTADSGGSFVVGKARGQSLVVRVKKDGGIDRSWGQKKGIVLWPTHSEGNSNTIVPVSTTLPGGEIIVVDPGAFISVIDMKGIPRRTGTISGIPGGAPERFTGTVLQVAPQGNKSVIILASENNGKGVQLFRVRLDGICQ